MLHALGCLLCRYFLANRKYYECSGNLRPISSTNSIELSTTMLALDSASSSFSFYMHGLMIEVWALRFFKSRAASSCEVRGYERGSNKLACASMHINLLSKFREFQCTSKFAHRRNTSGGDRMSWEAPGKHLTNYY